jgi:ubiquinone/menaquinone biosynthesis C-methylase UbiE
MRDEGNVEKAREIFLRNRFANLDFLLRRRYAWMNDYIQSGDMVVEIGCGAGFSQLYIKHKIILTDAIKYEWVDRVIDATSMDFDDDSIDIIIASQTIHHFYSPYKFLCECRRVLKPGGLILIQEINTSLMMRILLRLMRHEGWSYNCNVFDPDAIVNDSRDLWSANCAVPELLFSDYEIFNNSFIAHESTLTIVKKQLCEFTTFLAGGEVIAKAPLPIPELPECILKALLMVDDTLITMQPNIFALGMRVILQKNTI